ncbi:hypothetical protein FCN41_004450 [Escherichia coli]|nr:hypothetical protein [Escherichia coli]
MMFTPYRRGTIPAIRIADGTIQAHDDIDEEFFQPVLDGFLISKYTPFGILHALKDGVLQRTG